MKKEATSSRFLLPAHKREPNFLRYIVKNHILREIKLLKVKQNSFYTSNLKISVL